jgi:hypothetical protein
MNCIAYKAGYKYQLKQDYTITISIQPPADIVTPFITLTAAGELTMKSGYAWDGPSGPTIDTPNFMRGSLVHDALYQLMRERHLDRTECRDKADRILQTLCVEDGMSSPRAWLVYQAVSRFGDPAADPARDKPIRYAPRPCP